MTGVAIHDISCRRLRRSVVWASALFFIAAALACPSPAPAACASVPACLEATFPPDYLWGGLNPGSAGTESPEQATTVTSNQSWGVRLASDLADGRMKEWSGGAYVATAPKILDAPLEWTLSSIAGVAQPLSYRAVSSTPAAAVSNRPSTCPVDVCSSERIGVRYRQRVGFADAPAELNEYRILLSFEVAQGL